jgi:hypothetical protein
MKKHSAVILTTLLLGALYPEQSQSKETYKLVQEHKQVNKEYVPHRLVNSDVYSFCTYNDGTNKVCIDTTVEAKVGWEFT